jgi:flagellar biosynthesis protein FliR
MLTALLVVVRLAPVSILLPQAFSAEAPKRWGIALAVVCALAVTQRFALASAFSTIAAETLVLACLREVVLGLMLSLGCQLLLAGLCFGWLSLAVLLVSGGHRELIAALLEWFERVPPGGPLPGFVASPQLGQLLTTSFYSGLRVAAPVAFCLTVSSLLVAVLARTTPSLGALGLGVSVNLLMLLLITCLSIEPIATAYQEAWSAGLDRLFADWLAPHG